MENGNPASDQKGRLDLRDNYVMECFWYVIASIDTGMDSGLAIQVLRCFGILAVYIVACLTILLPIRFLSGRLSHFDSDTGNGIVARTGCVRHLCPIRRGNRTFFAQRE